MVQSLKKSEFIYPIHKIKCKKEICTNGNSILEKFLRNTYYSEFVPRMLKQLNYRYPDAAKSYAKSHNAVGYIYVVTAILNYRWKF